MSRKKHGMSINAARKLAATMDTDEATVIEAMDFVDRIAAYAQELRRKAPAMAGNVVINYTGPGADHPEETDWTRAHVVDSLHHSSSNKTRIRVYCPLRHAGRKVKRARSVR